MQINHREPIYVVGYPRSGNTWLSRLIGDVLKSPVEGYKNAKPLAIEGLDRPGHFSIRQLHLKPTRNHVDGVISGNEINEVGWKEEKIIFIIRDPRDVAVSAKFYWELPTIEDALHAMGNGTHPLMGVGKWSEFIGLWANTRIMATWTSYERLHLDPAMEVQSILLRTSLPKIPKITIDKVVSRQSISEKRKQVAMDGAGRPYGTAIQLKHLRNGNVGDWKNHFTYKDCELSQKYFGYYLNIFGYEIHDDWYEEYKDAHII